jgi:transposase InsO family protein
MSDERLTQLQKQRLTWVQLFEETNNAGFVCRRCGISRPTLRKWSRRYQALGVAGLLDQSRRPRRCPRQKVGTHEEQLILEIRRTRGLGIKRLRNELIRLHQLPLSLHTIHKILLRNHASRLAVRRWRRKAPTRYSRPIPGDRVQVDVCKIGPRLYHYAAIDDCTRYRVMGLYPRRSAVYTIAFLERVIEEMPFAIQRIQTDRGREFFALRVQQWLRDHAIKFRPIRPASPHLNGKIERAHQTDLVEFYATVNLQAPDLGDQLELWQHAYNWDRPHSALGGKTPIDRVCALIDHTPLGEDVDRMFDSDQERFRHPDYAIDLALSKLKRCM